MTWAGAAWAGEAWSGEAWTGEAPDAEDAAVVSLVALPPASALAAGPEVPYYWAARSGRAGSNYTGAYLLLGGDYVWWTLDGAGHDPRLETAELDGLTGHEVALTGGNRTATQVATATAAVIDAIDGWTCTADDDTLEIAGPAAVTTGASWDDADAGALIGMRASRVDGSGYGEGPISDALAQHLPNPGLALPILAVDVLLGGTVDSSDRFSVALYTAAGSTSPVGEDLVVDLGRIPAAQIVADSWARIYLPANLLVTADQAFWIGLKSELGLTQVGGYGTGSALIGDFTAQNLLHSDQGEASPVDPDATVPWPSTWTGTTAAGAAFVCGVRLVVGCSVGDASHHSADDPAIYGVHAGLGDLGSSTNIATHLFVIGEAPPFLGMQRVALGWGVGAVRGTQPRLGCYDGADVSDPDAPEVDGATVAADAGQLTGSSTMAWEERPVSPAVAWAASEGTAWAGKCDDDITGTDIAFAQGVDAGNADPVDAPMDWAAVPEYEVFPADSAFDNVDPTEPFDSPFVADPDDARPGNVPAARIRFYCPGITIVS